MNLAKSFLGLRSAQGYSNRADQVETLSDDEDLDVDRDGSSLQETPGMARPPDERSCRETSRRPFAALIPSMCPYNYDSQLEEVKGNVEAIVQQCDRDRYDEYGFCKDDTAIGQAASRVPAAAAGTAVVSEADTPSQEAEESQRLLYWTACLDLSSLQQPQKASLPAWGKTVELTISHSKKLDGLVRQGVPHALRPHVWPRLCGALEKRKSCDMSYRDVVRACDAVALPYSEQIDKDLLRILPSNVCFSRLTSTGIGRLRRVLRCLSWLYADMGYCPPMATIVATLLLFFEEEDAFWLMCTIIEDWLPASYFSSGMLGVQADQRVLSHLVSTHMPAVAKRFKDHDIEISLVSFNWFVTLYSSVLPMTMVLRIWDLLFYYGSIVLFQIALGMIKLQEEHFIELDNAGDIFSLLSDLPNTVHDVDLLLKAADAVAGHLTPSSIESLRCKQLAYLMAEHGAIINPEQTQHLPKQKVSKRHVSKPRSALAQLLWGERMASDDADLKAKNIRQTELLVDLRDAILQIARHFQNSEPALAAGSGGISLQADYSMESHARDLERYAAAAAALSSAQSGSVTTSRRRAKALIDFERHEDDELGFHKNDVVNVLSMRDEHCWLGELNGLQGWFPAKFVELLDERSKSYSWAGDDAVSEEITGLVRGALSSSLKAIFEHGLKKMSIIGGVTRHPWSFIEEAAEREVERDFPSVYSRLTLCRAFRLDEDGKILSPEELLYRTVQAINASHDQFGATDDVKLRSLICCGLNEQVLHLWLETLCSSVEVVEKWYDPWSYLRSPGWVQIKCELRLLSQLSFHLDSAHELDREKLQDLDFVQCVRDMLLQHHLFSWELIAKT